MRWPHRRNPRPEEDKAMQDAELALSIAQTLEVESAEVAARLHHRIIVNHLGPTIQRATGGR